MKNMLKKIGAVLLCALIFVGLSGMSPATAEKSARSSMLVSSTGEYKLIDGSKWLVIGDSNSTLHIDQIEGRSYTVFAPAMSKGKLFKQFSTATSGNRSDQQYVKLTQLLTAGHRPTMASVMVGTNDLSQGVAMSVWQTNVKKIVNKLIEFDIEPVIMTLPPRSGPTRATSPTIVEDTWNEWLKEYAISKNLLYVDVWKTVADPTTREFKTGFYNTTDGVHVNGRGQYSIACEFIRVVGPHLRAVDPVSKQALMPDADDPWNLLPRGVFTSSSNSGWNMYGRTNVEADSYAPGGYALNLNADASDGLTMVASDKLAASGKFAGGQKMKIVLKSRIYSSTNNWSGSGLRLIVREWQGSEYTDVPTEYFGQNLVNNSYLDHSWEWTVTPGTTATTLYWKFEPGPGGSRQIHAHLGSIGLYNLTKLGLK